MNKADKESMKRYIRMCADAIFDDTVFDVKVVSMLQFR